MSISTGPFCKTVSYRIRNLLAHNTIKINIPHLYILAIPCFKKNKPKNPSKSSKALLPIMNFKIVMLFYQDQKKTGTS